MDCGLVSVYVLVKALAYMAWCWHGARLHDHHDRLALRAFLYGLVKLAMGLVPGLFLIVLLAGALANIVPVPVVLYVAVCIPVRWLEWSLMAVIIDVDRRSLHNFLSGDTGASRLWRLGGVVISCVADLPLLVTGGLDVRYLG